MSATNITFGEAARITEAGYVLIPPDASSEDIEKLRFPVFPRPKPMHGLAVPPAKSRDVLK
jgi:hypothetical protein